MMQAVGRGQGKGVSHLPAAGVWGREGQEGRMGVSDSHSCLCPSVWFD
jgi:hypothetical protein